MMIYRRLYTLVFYCLLPVILLRLLFRSLKAPAYRYRWAERFGFFSCSATATSSSDRKNIWVHAVSVGEVLAAVPLIHALQHQYPDTCLVVTTTTPTGSERVQALFARDIAEKKLLHVYAPYDIPFALGHFLKRTNPRLAIVMETEMWPNMIHACFTNNIPLVLVNARLSEKSAKGYARLSGLTKAMLNEISLIAAQNSQDGNRFIDLGLPEKKLTITGSIKFDLEITALIKQQAVEIKESWVGSGKRLVFLAASTHAGEDEIILSVFKECKKTCPDFLLVLVPRHPERFNSVHQLCMQDGFITERRSQSKIKSTHVVSVDADVVLGDTMGELLAFYGACDIAFVGGSLVPVGGHNLIEPAAWSKPILSGRHIFNFTEISDLLIKNNALLICDTGKDFHRELEMLLLSESKRLSMGDAAQRIANENRGALQRLMAAIRNLII